MPKIRKLTRSLKGWVGYVSVGGKSAERLHLGTLHILKPGGFLNCPNRNCSGQQRGPSRGRQDSGDRSQLHRLAAAVCNPSHHLEIGRTGRQNLCLFLTKGPLLYISQGTGVLRDEQDPELLRLLFWEPGTQGEESRARTIHADGPGLSPSSALNVRATWRIFLSVPVLSILTYKMTMTGVLISELLKE